MGVPVEKVREFGRLVADDSHACTFQSLGQYRSALLAAIGELYRFDQMPAEVAPAASGPHVALFVGGPADGTRRCVEGLVQRVAVPESPELGRMLREHDSRVVSHEYRWSQVVGCNGAHSIYVAAHIANPVAALIDGYRAARR